MITRTIRHLLLTFLCLTTVASAADRPIPTSGSGSIHGGNSALNKAVADTIDVMGPTGSGAPYLGDFEDGWNGWTSIDVTQPTVTHWQVSDYNQAMAGNLAAWCGDITFASCNDSLDPVGGYGNSWHDLLAYRMTVTDPALSALVNVRATLQIDTEPTYDYVHLSTKMQGDLNYTNLQSWDGAGTVAVNNSVTFLPADLAGGTDVLVHFRVMSDGGFSDADCQFTSAGACQIDDITVMISQAGQPDIVSYTDFQDGTLGDWVADFPPGVGDFAGLWSGLRDMDPCRTNVSQQVAFIDNGLVVPGTGGSECINWCYGPGGFIVTTTGGLAGPTGHIQNDIYSPVMNWPAENYDGVIISFDVYRHEDLSADAPGIFYTWAVRSADTDGSAGNGVQIITEEGFTKHNWIWYGGPDYVRQWDDMTDLMHPGRDQIQTRMGVYELGWAWGWIGNDGYPAPYFDNVSVKVFPYAGPGMRARELDLANDNFPEVDALDFADLGAMHVRFDMANNISLATHMRNDPGDSMVVDIAPVRSGASLAGSPEMHYIIAANPVFNAYRTTATSGFVLGVPAVGASGLPQPDRWAFDLPDTGTLFPGDVLHYYIRAGDEVAGDIQWATMPADLTGYGDFSDPLAYNSTFVIHALPTITSDGFGGYNLPGMLFWNDFANRGGEDEWYGAFRSLGLQAGVDYDIYYTNGPSSGVGNGLGGRTSGLALKNYHDLLYTAGNLGVNTIANGDFNNDAGDDIGAILTWLSDGHKDLLLTGDDVASDLAINAGVNGLGFVESVMGLNVTSDFLPAFIDNQVSPLVLASSGNPVFLNINTWIAYGGCQGLNTFDAVTTRTGAARLAEFGDPNGNSGAYGFSAATLNFYNTTNRIISLPYDLMYVYTDPQAKVAAPLPGRGQILSDVLDYFGVVGTAQPSPVPAVGRLAVAHWPNPFNPATRISYTIGAPGHLSLKIYNLRGQLVRTLLDERVETDGFVMWDGTDKNGAQVASGVYFREARLGGEVSLAKMALIK